MLIKKIISTVTLLTLLTTSSIAGGNLFNVATSGDALASAVNFTLCLNVQGSRPVSCQNFVASRANLSFTTTIPRTYNYVGIKINTPGFAFNVNQGLLASKSTNTLRAASGFTLIGSVSNTRAASGTVSSTTAPTTYTVGGTVTGLSNGTTVVLENNSTDSKSISDNGSFTFATALTAGAAYSVSVATQPSGQICSVTNGSGTVTANVTDVSVTCATQVTSFTTPGSATYTVPAGITSLSIVATGAGGGGGDLDGSTGGNGGVVTTTLSVNPGDVLQISVGGGGKACSAGSICGAGGGGSSSVNAGTASQIIAGGGGGSNNGFINIGGDGGGPGTSSGSQGSSAASGAGGANGNGGINPYVPTYNGVNGNGGAGGAGGDGVTAGGSGGSGTGLGTGGEGMPINNNPFGFSGGGGGGGFGGGGGGAASGGGGGSIGPNNPTYSVSSNGGAANSNNGGDGSVVITIQ